MKYYAGIGSRKTPPRILEMMTYFAVVLSKKGYTLRSGGADGADSAFYEGCNGNCQIFIPWDGFNGHKRSDTIICNITEKHFEMAAKNHPAWNNCSFGAKKLHARNTQQVFGENLDDPIDFLICWTPNGQIIGGTATAIKMAAWNNIPVYNLALKEDITRLEQTLLMHR